MQGNGSKIAERGSHKDLGESLNSVEDHLESFNVSHFLTSVRTDDEQTLIQYFYFF